MLLQMMKRNRQSLKFNSIKQWMKRQQKKIQQSQQSQLWIDLTLQLLNLQTWMQFIQRTFPCPETR